MGSSRLILAGAVAALLGAGCVGAPADPPAPPAVAPGRPVVVVVSEEGRRATPVARCGAGCAQEPTATPDAFFERFASTVSTQTALIPTAGLTNGPTGRVDHRAATTPVVDAAARSLAEPPASPTVAPSPSAAASPTAGADGAAPAGPGPSAPAVATAATGPKGAASPAAPASPSPAAPASPSPAAPVSPSPATPVSPSPAAPARAAASPGAAGSPASPPVGRPAGVATPRPAASGTARPTQVNPLGPLSGLLDVPRQSPTPAASGTPRAAALAAAEVTGASSPTVLPTATTGAPARPSRPSPLTPGR